MEGVAVIHGRHSYPLRRVAASRTIGLAAAWEPSDGIAASRREGSGGGSMRQALHRFTTATNRKGLYDVTGEVARWVAGQGIETGLLTVFCRHTSASLVIQENADPTVRSDMERFFERIAPENAGYAHSDEGPDDMPAHLRAALTQTSLSIPIGNGRLLLGTWQGLYLFEHRSRPHRREIVLHVIGA
jgi:secondary thiamine-phosphate synthase enzyme